MKALTFLTLLLALSSDSFADDRPTIHSLAGREFRIEDDSAGQELAFRKSGESLVAIWRILGSGIRVISETESPVELRSPWQIVFEVGLRNQTPGTIKVGIYPGGETRAYLNGVRIPLEEIKSSPH